MERFRGQILRDGQVVFDGIEGSLSIDVGQHGNEHWYGFFTLPTGEMVKHGEGYELKLEDGRTKRVEIVRVNSGENRPTVASFDGRD